MKKSILLIATIAALAPCLPVAANAATQVYDLRADWSDTANPNGTWSYREGDSLMINNPFPWVGGTYPTQNGQLTVPGPTIVKIGEVSIAPENLLLEPGDVVISPGINSATVLWTAPASGAISISGTFWPVEIWTSCCPTPWTLSHNASFLSAGDVPNYYFSEYYKNSPYDLSLGSGGTAALQNIPVAAGDQIVLTFTGLAVGVNFGITLTPDSVDPITAIEDLALTVVEMNLQNGIENSLDSKLDAAINALIDANFNNDSAACNSLAAFICAVEAQRGNKVTNPQADQLIASAQEIRDLLNCGN